MLCPECSQLLLIVECDRVELDACVVGHGIWFDSDEIRQLFELTEAPDTLLDLEQRLMELKAHQGKKRRCPRCRTKMRQVEAPGGAGEVILDQCPRGHGLWFDEGELHDVLSAELGEQDEILDTVRDYLGSFCEPRQEEKGNG